MYILGQRGKLEKLMAAFSADDFCWRLVFCLRLAALLNRARDDRMAALDVRLGLRRGKVAATGGKAVGRKGEKAGKNEKNEKGGDGRNDRNGSRGENGAFSLVFPTGWLAANPLSASALAEEAAIWQRAGFGLTIRRRAATGGAG